MCPVCQAETDASSTVCPKCSFPLELENDREELIKALTNYLEHYKTIKSKKDFSVKVKAFCIKLALYMSILSREELSYFKISDLKLVYNDFFRVTNKLAPWNNLDSHVRLGLLERENYNTLVREHENKDLKEELSKEKDERVQLFEEKEVEIIDNEEADAISQSQSFSGRVKKKKAHFNKEALIELLSIEDPDYDGYYDSRLPKDYGQIQERPHSGNFPWGYALALGATCILAIGYFIFPFI